MAADPGAERESPLDLNMELVGEQLTLDLITQGYQCNIPKSHPTGPEG